MPQLDAIPVLFRALAPAAESVALIERDGGDYNAGVIRRVAVATRGPASGHGLWLDGVFLKSLADAINAQPRGVKCRFMHPREGEDGIGRQVGKLRDARVEGDVVKADLHMLSSAKATPDGDLATYLITLAAEAPEDFGLSVAGDMDPDAMELFLAANQSDGVFRSPDPKNVEHLPHLRLAALYGVDVVQTPAANPTGLFNRKNATKNIVAKVRDVVARLFAARGFATPPEGEIEMAICKLPDGTERDDLTAEQCAAAEGEYTPDAPAEEEAEMSAEQPKKEEAVAAAEPAATPAQLAAALPKADKAFLFDCAAKGMSLSAAKDAYITQLESKATKPAKSDAPRVTVNHSATSGDGEPDYEAQWKQDEKLQREFFAGPGSYARFMRAQKPGSEIRINQTR